MMYYECVLSIEIKQMKKYQSSKANYVYSLYGKKKIIKFIKLQ